MALPVSPPLSVSQIYAEFLVPPGTLFTQLYRGGPYVPNTPQNAAISTNPNALSVSQFYGAVRYVQFEISASPPAVDETVLGGPGSPSSTTVAGVTHINTSNGSGSFSFAWSLISGTAMTLTPANGGRDMTFSAVISKGLQRSAIYRCTVNDGVGSTRTVDVSVVLRYEAA